MATLAEMLRQGSWESGSGDTRNQLVNALRGVAETGMTLGTSALAGLAGMPYGVYKGITSGAYGTPEAPRIAAKEAQQFMERNTYQPRTEQGQEYVQKLGRMFEESKLPPVMPEVAALGAIPKQAYAAQAERAGMAAEKALEPAIMRTMERGGKPAQLLEDLAQGTRRQIFIGENSKSWNKGAEELALKMEKAGNKPEDIWMATGTFRGPEGKLRQEISDKGAKITDDVFEGIKANQEFKGPASQALTHSELYAAYPNVAKIESGLFANATPEGSYHAPTDTILAGGPSTGAQRSAMLHELQHAIQQREGFIGGASPSEPYPAGVRDQIIKDQFDQLKALTKYDPSNPYSSPNVASDEELLKRAIKNTDEIGGVGRMDAYHRSAGEAEARAVQKRMNMTDEERRSVFPYESYDVPKEQLIIKGVYK